MRINVLPVCVASLATILFGALVEGQASTDGGQTPAAATTPIAVPATPAGAQLEWFLGVLSGKEPTDIDRRMSPKFKEFITPTLLGRQLQIVSQSILGGGPAVLDTLDAASTRERVAGRIRSEANGTVMSFWITVEPETGLIDGLSSQVIPGAAADAAKTWEELDVKLAAKPGTVYLYTASVGEDGLLTPIHVRNGDARLGTGSTFKLYVLGALAEMVMEGKASWDQPLAIRDDWKSLPSGTMQDELPGAEHPLSHYALKMISISDNTATDHLIEFVGRERVEAFMARLNADPARSTPFLKTRELFALKLAEDRTLGERYIAADVPTRRAMLAPEGEVGKTAPNLMAAAFWRKPVWIDTLEWFCTGEECARVMVEVDRLSRVEGNGPVATAIRTNPGMGFDRKMWKGVAFKGGSEIGVINLTWLLERADGRRFVVSFGWNDPKSAVDDEGAVKLAGEAVGMLERLE
jgi:hypothetical protein